MIVIGWLALCCTGISAQDLPVLGQLYFMRLLSNPALTAYNGSSNLSGYYNNQLTAVRDHPVTSGATGELSLWKDRIGVGFQVNDNTVVIDRNISAQVLYAQKIRFARDHQLSLGFAAGILNIYSDYSKAILSDVTQPLPYTSARGSAFDLSVGLAYQWKKLTIGIAIPKVLGNYIRTYNSVGFNQYWFQRTYATHGSYELNFKNETFNLEPGVLFTVKDKNSYTFLVSAMANYKRIVYLGVGYRLNYGMPVTVAVKIAKAVTLSYAYTAPLMNNTPVAALGGSHEVMLSVCFDRWTKKAPAATIETAAVAGQTTYDSLLARLAAQDSLNAKQTTVDSLAQKLDALQRALESTQRANTEAEAQKKEQEEKLNELNKQIETKLHQQAEAKAREKEKEKQEVQAVQETNKKEAAPQKPTVEKPAIATKTQNAAPAKAPVMASEAQDFSDESNNKKAPAAGDRFKLNQVGFERNGSDLTESSYAELDKLVGYMKSHKTIRVRIVGHTDNRASETYNGWLSRLRARAVADYLKSKGIADNRIEAIGMGPRMPVADNETEEGRAKNRRVEVEIEK